MQLKSGQRCVVSESISDDELRAQLRTVDGKDDIFEVCKHDLLTIESIIIDTEGDKEIEVLVRSCADYDYGFEVPLRWLRLLNAAPRPSSRA